MVTARVGIRLEELKYREEIVILPQSPWWKGTHGEWYVVVQVGLIVLVFFGPRNIPAWPRWTPPFTWLVSFCSRLRYIGWDQFDCRSLRLVRHPMYCGRILISLGWAFLAHGWLTLGYAIIILVIFDFKPCREEEWLKANYPGNRDYQQRVRKLIPFV